MTVDQSKSLFSPKALAQLPGGYQKIAAQLVQGDGGKVVVFQREVRTTPLPGPKPTSDTPSSSSSK